MKLKFGVEIEFYGVHYQAVIDSLRQAGIAVADYEGYTHAVIPKWKITTDVSVTSIGTGLPGRGLELVSPILYGDEGLDELEKVYTVLNSLGAKVDKSCGTHVHFDIADYTVDNMKSFLNLFFKYQNVINYLVPKSRRDVNSYCQPITHSQISYINRPINDSIRDIASALLTRYKKINLQSYVKYGTLEVRQHGGTTEFEKIEAWIVLMYQMIVKAKEQNFECPSSIRRATNVGIMELLKVTNLDDTYTGEYLMARYKHFKEVA